MKKLIALASTAVLLTIGQVQGVIAHSSIPISKPPISALETAKTIVGWHGCVRLIHDPNNSAHSSATEVSDCFMIHLNSDDGGKMGPRYAEHALYHELCHIAVGLNHGHDLVFRACMTKASSAIGMQEIYYSEGASYPYRINDLRTNEHWDWAINAELRTE